MSDDKCKDFDDTQYSIDTDVEGCALGGGMLETFEPDISVVLHFANGEHKQNVWTIIDGEDDDNLYIIAGYHYVNRLYYVITNEKWTNDYECYVWMTDMEEPEYDAEYNRVS